MDKIIKNRTVSRCKGTHLFTKCDATNPKVKFLSQKIQELTKIRDLAVRSGHKDRDFFEKIKEAFQHYKKQLFVFKTNEFVIENLTTTIGRSVIAENLAEAVPTRSIAINYTALGTDDTAPNVADATLGAEGYRKPVSSGDFIDNTAYLETFFGFDEANDTWEEFGMFQDANAAANSGILFNRFTQQVVKINSETLNVQSIFEINNA